MLAEFDPPDGELEVRVGGAHRPECVERELVDGWPCWSIGNHDVVRVMSRWALANQPGLVLADQATGILEPYNKTLILDLLFDSVDAHGATLLAVTHDHELLPRFDRVVDFATFRARAGA